MVSLIYVITVFTLLFQTGNCLNCYNCISKSNRQCINPLAHESFKPQPCNMDQINQLAEQAQQIAQQLGNAFGVDIGKPEQKQSVPLVCQKVVTRVGNEEVIIRGCSLPSQQDATYCSNLQKMSGSQVITHCSLCDTEGCNSGNNLVPLSFISLFIATITISIWTIITA